MEAFLDDAPAHVNHCGGVQPTRSRPVQISVPSSSRLQLASLADRAVAAVATVDDLAAGISAVVELVRSAVDAGRVEWWSPVVGDASLRLEACTGRGRGERVSYPLATGDELRVVGGADIDLAALATALAPLLRRRRAEERLAAAAIELARRNEMLEDFAALVAHELKAPLNEIVLGGDPAAAANRALDLVDEVLGFARAGSDAAAVSVANSLASVLDELEPIEATVESSLVDECRLPAAAARLLLRNLIRNACAAGAKRITVATARSVGWWTLTVDDDGVGIGGREYAAGSGVGFGLCARLAERLGGTLNLQPCGAGGTRAQLLISGGTP